MRKDRRSLVILGVTTIVQAVLFYNEPAVALTFLFALGIGIWIRDWTAAWWALASFAVAFLLAAVTGWLESFRFWDLLIGAALAFLGGLIGGGIFQALRGESAAARPERIARAA